MKNFIYVDDTFSLIDHRSFIVHIDKIIDEDDLLEDLYSKLNFPDYFGFNWNALSDCLRDFHWMEYHRIIIVHDDIPSFNDQVLKLYLDVLYSAINDWKEGEEHELEVVFPKQSKERIESLIASPLVARM
ncbi:MAG: barstar family protein [Bacteroidota bacterium]|nr:barstar family protein [Bacteroidota bacterium]